MPQAIEANPENWRVSGEFGLSEFSVIRYAYDLGKNIRNYLTVAYVTKILQNFRLTQI